MILGHDIANVNGQLDLSDYPAAQFFIAKASQDATFDDKLFENFRQQARDLGRGFGGYHYGDNQEQPDPVASVERFLELLGEQQAGEVAALDVEIDGGHGGFKPGDHSEWVYQWGIHFQRLASYKPYLYVSGAGISDFGLDKPDIADAFNLWYAYWLNDPAGTTPPVSPSPFATAGFKLWQFNADVIDKNYFLGTLDEFKATGKPGVQAPGQDYEERFWTPIDKLIDECALSGRHADVAFHAAISNVITLHKVAYKVEPVS